MKCSKCNKPISVESYLLSKGLVRKEPDEDGYMQIMGKVTGSSLLCPNCVPSEIKNDVEKDSFEDCVRCDIDLKDDDIYYMFYKLKNDSIKKGAMYCENCMLNEYKED
jgi:hypothetical protein